MAGGSRAPEKTGGQLCLILRGAGKAQDPAVGTAGFGDARGSVLGSCVHRSLRLAPSPCPAAPRLQSLFSLSPSPCHCQTDLTVSSSGSLKHQVTILRVAFEAPCRCPQLDSQPQLQTLLCPPLPPGSAGVYARCSPDLPGQLKSLWPRPLDKLPLLSAEGALTQGRASFCRGSRDPLFMWPEGVPEVHIISSIHLCVGFFFSLVKRHLFGF